MEVSRRGIALGRSPTSSTMHLNYIPSTTDRVFFLIQGACILLACLSHMAGMPRGTKIWTLISALGCGLFAILAFYVRR